MTVSSEKLNRVQLVEKIKNLPIETESNIKFLMILRSRLMEEGIVPEYASLIAGVVDFDLKNVPEDDDTLSDIATEYASYCKKVYDKLKLFGVHYIKDFSTYARYFKPFKIEVEH